MQCGIHRGLHHHLLVSRGILLDVGSYLGSSFAWSLRGAEGHDPDLWGQGTLSVWMALSWSPLSWIPSHSGWDHTSIQSIRIWTMGIVPVATMVQCRLIGAAWHEYGVQLE